MFFSLCRGQEEVVVVEGRIINDMVGVITTYLQRFEERAIPEEVIKKAKAQGKMTLSIHFNGQEDTNDVKDQVSWWGDRLKEAFEQLEVGDVIEKGREDGRLEVELHGSEKLCSAINE